MSRALPYRLALLLLAVASLLAPLRAAASDRISDRIYDATAAPAIAGPPRSRKLPESSESIYDQYDLDWLTLVYHPSVRERVRPIITGADKVRAELSALLGREVLKGRVEVRIMAATAEMEALAPKALEGAPTRVAFAFKDTQQIVVISADSRTNPSDLMSVFRHELAHLALDEATGGADIPGWLHEGFAVYVAGEQSTARARTLCLASLRGRLLHLGDLGALLAGEAQPSSEARASAGPSINMGRDSASAGPSIAHAQAADLARYLVHVDRGTRFGDFIGRVQRGEAAEDALALAYGGGLDALDAAWRADMAKRYGFAPVLAGALLAIGIAIGTVLGVRRLRRPRPRIVPARRPVRGEVQPRARAPRPIASPVVAARVSRARAGADSDGDPDVPKVEHDGRWYTLH